MFSNSTCTALRNGTGFNPDNETEWLLFAEQVFRLEGEQEQVEYATFDKNLESSTRLMRPDTAYMYRPSDTGYPDGKGACYNRMVLVSGNPQKKANKTALLVGLCKLNPADP